MKTMKNVKLENTLHKMLEMLMLIKMYHWKTNSYSSHKATDHLYSSLNEHMDKFVEIWLGKNNKKLNAQMNISVTYVSNKTKLTSKVKLFIQHLEGLQLDSDLLTIRDDIVGELNQFLYLLTFK
jgi:DNA-binding ferritin-like protein